MTIDFPPADVFSLATLTRSTMRTHTFFNLFLAALLTAVLTSGALAAAAIKSTKGDTKVTIEGQTKDAEENLELPVGAQVITGKDGEVYITLAPGVVIKLLPDSQIKITAWNDDTAEDADGNKIPQIRVTLTSGSLVAIVAEGAETGVDFRVVTSRGSVAPTSSGAFVVSVNGDTTTIIADTAALNVVDNAGKTVNVEPGFGTLLAPGTTELRTLPNREIPGSGALLAASSNAVAGAAGFIGQPGPILPQPVPESDVPPNLPQPRPTATPTPTPTPTPIPPLSP